MPEGTKLGGAYVEIEAKLNKLEAGLKTAEQRTKDAAEKMKKSVHTIQDAFQSAKLKFDTEFPKMKLKDLEKTAKDLRAEFEKKKINPNISVASLDLTKYKLGQVEGALKGVQNQSGKTSGGFSSMFSGGIAQATMFLGKITVAYLAVKKIFTTAVENAKLQNLRNAFDSIVSKSGTNAVDLLNELKHATAGAVKEFDLLKAVNKGSFLGVDVKAMPTLLRFATIRAQETGESIDYLVDSIIVGLGRKSPLILDNLGLTMKDLDKAVIDVAKSHGVLINAVDETARAEYLTEAAVRVAQKAIDDSSVSINNLATQTATLETNWDKFAKGASDTFTPVFSTILGIFNEMLDVAGDLDKELDNLLSGKKKSSPMPELKDEPHNADFMKGNKRFVPGKGIITIVEPKVVEDLKIVANIEKKIEDLTKAQKNLNVESKEFTDNLKEITRLQGLLDPMKDAKQKADEKRQIEQKLYTELQFISETYKTYRNKLINDEVKKLKEAGIDSVEIQKWVNQEKIKLAEDEKNFFNPENINLKDVFDSMGKGDESSVLDSSIDENALDKENERLQESIKTLEDLRLKAIYNEFARRREQINLEYDDLLLRFTENEAIKAEIEKARIQELSDLQSEMYSQVFSEINNIGNTLTSAFNIASDSFVGKLMQALSIAQSIASVIQSISTISNIFSTISSIAAVAAAPATGGLSLAGLLSLVPGRASGGSVEANQIYKVGERGQELFIPNHSGTIIPNHNFTNNVGSDKKTDLLIQEVKSLNQTLRNKNFNPSLSLKINEREIGKSVTSQQNRYGRQGLNRNDL